MAEHRQYERLLAAAAERLRAVGLDAAAVRAGLERDADGGLRFETLGQAVRLDPETLEIAPPIDMWHHLCVLQYLAGTSGASGVAGTTGETGAGPSDRWLGLSELPGGGTSRGASFDREIDGMIANRLGGRSEAAIRGACEKLGAAFVRDARADVCADFRFMPRWPLRLSLWLADDEFSASGKVRVNAGVAGCLGLEAAGTAAEILAARLCGLCEGE